MASRNTGRSTLWAFAQAAFLCLLASQAVDAKHSPAAAPDQPMPTKAVAVAVRDLESRGPVLNEGGAQVQLGRETGVLRRWWLRQPGSAKAQAPRAAADRFLAENASRLGLDPARIASDLQLVDEKTSLSGTHYRYQQVVNGVPVYRGDLVIKVSKRGEVSSMQNNLRPNLALVTTPSFGAGRAVQIGTQAVQPTGKPLGDFSADLRVVVLDSGPRLAWLVSLPVEAPMGDWLVFVDARSGSVFGVEDRMTYVDGTGRVFDPDPRTKMNNATYVDNSDANSAVPFPAAYDTRTLSGITNTSGTYSLSGPYAKLIDFESPVIAPVTATHPDSFQFQRNPDSFEDVNVYFHLDQNERYIQSLGFTNINNRIQEVDSHGLNGDDNSHYIPSTKRLAFGDGGVDDAEDADVVIHEYGHSIQDNIVPGWGGAQEGAMGEGFGDYWAGSYSISINPTFQPGYVFNWDGHNTFWPGRVLVDSTLHYPEDCCGEVHDSGTLWCSGITDCLRRVGRPVMDRLVLDHHFALGTSATMEDAANQIIQSDIDLYGGTHLQTIVNVFGFWGFVNPADFVPTITHTPLADTENTTGPYDVVATIVSIQPLDSLSLKVHWGIGALTDSLLMTATANPNEYSASIPGPQSGVDVRYYIIAKDTGGGTTTHPSGAPGNDHQFHVGPDLTPPVIVHSPIADFPLVSWPATVNATVTDNLGVNTSSVLVDWTLNSAAQTSFNLARIGVTDNYSAAFPAVSAAVGDTVRYHISASDVATIPNTDRHPVSGEHAFVIIDILGRVLVLDDDDVAKGVPDVKLVEVEGTKDLQVLREKSFDPGDVVQSAQSMATILNGLGYEATVENAFTSNPATWSSYDLLIHSSGANTSPLTNATYRAALETWVAGGGKLLVEGGEVVYDCANYPGYPTFAANVLHSTDWDADEAGTLNLLVAQTSHPIATTPNALPASLPIAYAGYGSEDSYKPNAPAYIVYAVTTQPANGGILVYDDNPAPESAQIVVFGFDFKVVGDASARAHLLANTARYLLALESAPSGSITGVAKLANQLDHAGIVVTATPGGATGTTDSDGNYTVSNLYAGSYTLTAVKAGFAPETRTAVVVQQGQITSGQDFKLYPQPEVEVCVAPNLAIPDANATGITSTQNVSATWAVQAVQVTVNITHTFIGDLTVDLHHGSKTVRLHNRTGGSSENIIGTYPTTLTVDGPGALADFVNDPANGAWDLLVADRAAVDTGRLVSWCLKLRGPKDTTVDLGSDRELPQVASLGVGTNPVGRKGTVLRFALPQAGQATLALYDVGGHRVRTLADGTFPSGWHAAEWDGRDARGKRVAAGIYFTRLTAGSVTRTQKLVVLQ